MVADDSVAHGWAGRPGIRLTVALSIAVAIFAAVNAVAFFAGAYRAILDPQSSTGTFERAVTQIRRWPADAARDVLVLGDSRIYYGLDPALADVTARGLRFVDAGVPGTDPRCWYFFDRAVDGSAHRFRAVVIPVDSYADDTSALGSLDADDHPTDFRAIVLETRPRDIPAVVRAFYDPMLAHGLAFDLALRGPMLREDFQALLADPLARRNALAHASPEDFAPRAVHALISSLAGLRVDFRDGRLVAPSWVDAAERRELAEQIVRVPVPSTAYATYRRVWLGALVARYVAARVPVVFVRIPTRPLHRSPPAGPSGSLVDIAAAARGDVALVPQEPDVALERPDYFADQDHLNVAGSRAFSALLGRDVARALRRVAPARTRDVPARPTRMHPHRLREALDLVWLGAPLLFGSIDFGVFFAVVIVAFYAAPRRARTVVLLLASYYFYARWNAWYVGFLLFLTATDFAIGLRLEVEHGRRRQILLALGIALNLAFLGSFKYTNLVTGTVAALAGRHGDPWYLAIAVPIGISFHTFQSISYLVDVARGQVRAQRRVLDYALYLAFFPQLLAGPIVRAGRFFGELGTWRAPDADRVERGLREILIGLIKKLVIADRFGPVADAYFSTPAQHPGAVAAWSAVFAFTVQIYFDFSGYSDVAIGTARLLGFDFAANFARPYFAWSVTEFWRRWHITLSTWLRDYLYIPLGGNRHGRVQTYRNLFITMLLGGLWHGANWTFVAWGAYHGACLAVERACGVRARRPSSGFEAALRIAPTLVVVMAGWVLFRATSFADAGVVYRAMLLGGAGPWTLPVWSLLLLIPAAAIGVAQERGARWEWRRRPIVTEAAVLAMLGLVLEMVSWPGAAAPFIYFKF